MTQKNKSKGQFSGRTGFVIFAVFFIVLASALAATFNVSGVDCTEPSTILQEPGENATTVDRVIDPANDVIDVFFGCSSDDVIVDGFFTALKAGIIIVLLFIAKDLVPFT